MFWIALQKYIFSDQKDLSIQTKIWDLPTPSTLRTSQGEQLNKVTKQNNIFFLLNTFFLNTVPAKILNCVTLMHIPKLIAVNKTYHLAVLEVPGSSFESPIVSDWFKKVR